MSVYVTLLSAGVVWPPVDTMVRAGETATFTCDAGDAPDVTWKINGTFLNDLSLEVLADIDFDGPTVDNTYELTILAKPEYNTTAVQCVAVGDLEQNDSEVAHLYIG